MPKMYTSAFCDTRRGSATTSGARYAGTPRRGADEVREPMFGHARVHGAAEEDVGGLDVAVRGHGARRVDVLKASAMCLLDS